MVVVVVVVLEAVTVVVVELGDAGCLIVAARIKAPQK